MASWAASSRTTWDSQKDFFVSKTKGRASERERARELGGGREAMSGCYFRR